MNLKYWNEFCLCVGISLITLDIDEQKRFLYKNLKKKKKIIFTQFAYLKAPHDK